MAPTARNFQNPFRPNTEYGFSIDNDATSQSMYSSEIYCDLNKTQEGVDDIQDFTFPTSALGTWDQYPSFGDDPTYSSDLQILSERRYGPGQYESSDLPRDCCIATNASSCPSMESPNQPKYPDYPRRPSAISIPESSGQSPLFGSSVFDSSEPYGYRSGFSTTSPSSTYSYQRNPPYLKPAQCSSQRSSPEMLRRQSFVSKASESPIYSSSTIAPFYFTETPSDLDGHNLGLGINPGIFGPCGNSFASEVSHPWSEITAHEAAISLGDGAHFSSPEISVSTFVSQAENFKTRPFRGRTHTAAMSSSRTPISTLTKPSNSGQSLPYSPTTYLPPAAVQHFYSSSGPNPVNRLPEIPVSQTLNNFRSISQPTAEPFISSSFSPDYLPQQFPHYLENPNTSLLDGLLQTSSTKLIPIPNIHVIPLSAPLDGRCPNPECKGKIVRDLKAHLLSHQSSRPEKCLVVGCEFYIKGFARKHDRNRHLLTHYKGIMVCGFCPASASFVKRSFNRTDLFKKHLISEHQAVGTEHDSACVLKGGKKTAGALSSFASSSSKKQRRVNGSSSVLPSEYGEKPKIARCSVCSGLFDDVEAFYRHLDDCICSRILLQQTEKEEQRTYDEDEEEKENLNRGDGW